MQIRLRYGDGTLRFEVPTDRVRGVHRPRVPEDASGPAALDRLPHGPAADEIRAATAGRTVLFLVPDETRGEPTERTLGAALACLDRPARVRVVVATGSHRADTPGNRAVVADAERALAAAGHPFDPPVVHDCRLATFRDHGTTKRGTRVLLSDVLDDAEVIFPIGDVKHHYFAGYSNPTKCLVPGIAAFETIEANHRLSLEPDAEFGRHPFHPDPDRRSNPLAEDMIEAFEGAAAGRPAFALATVTVGGRLAHADVGPVRATLGRAMTVADRLGAFPVPPGRRVVISAGGSPMDRTLYLAQRALELTRNAVADGAEVLFLAECRDGIADSPVAMTNFYEELARPLPEVRERIRLGYRLYQHKAYRFAELLERIDRLHIATSLPDDSVRRIHLEPVPDPVGLVQRWADEAGPDSGITFFDEANRLCVLRGGPS